MQHKKDAFLLYVDTLAVVDTISDEQCACLFRAIYHYHYDMVLPEMDHLTKTLFILFKTKFDSDIRSYNKKIESKSNSGKLGNLKRWNKPLYELVVKNGLSLEDAYKIHEQQISKETYKKYGIDRNISQCDDLSQSDDYIAKRGFIATDPLPLPLPKHDPLPLTNPKHEQSEKNLDRNHVFFSGLDDKTIDALLEWFQYQQEHFNLKIDSGYLKSLKPIIVANIEAGNDIEYSVNFIMSSRNADGSRTKTLRYFVNPNAEAKNKNLSPEDRKKQKDAQLKKEDRDRILSNYCKGVTYEEAYLTLNKKRKGEIEHYPLRVAEVITKLECDKYMIKYPTRGDWELLNTEREGFLLTNGNFLKEDCE